MARSRAALAHCRTFLHTPTYPHPPPHTYLPPPPPPRTHTPIRFPDVVEKISTNYYCARRSYYHTMTPDQTSTVPAINYPAHHDHNLGSKFKENFCSRFRGWIEIPADGRYNFKAECSDGCRLYLGFRDTKNLYAASNRVLYYDGRQVARDRKVRPWCAAVVCRRGVPPCAGAPAHTC